MSPRTAGWIIWLSLLAVILMTLAGCVQVHVAGRDITKSQETQSGVVNQKGDRSPPEKKER